MSWLIQVFIENTRMSHFFLSLSVSLFVIARLVIYFFMSLPDLNGQSVSFPQPSTLSPVPLNIIVLPFSPLSLPSPLSVITRLDRVISLPLPPIFRMPRSSRSMTGWSDNYSTFLLFLPLFLTFFSFGHYPNILFSLPLSPTSSSLCHYPT